MPDSIVKETIREIEPLSIDDNVAEASKRVIELKLPGLPAVDSDGKFAGIFGEREFLAALFPGYMNELSSTAMIKRSIDHTIDRRVECAAESIEKYLTKDHVLVEDDYSDTQLAELFLHHRVLVIPIATKGKVHAIVTRADYFEAVARRFVEQVEG
ncbi:MAG TPA: CBS domain-containing protein [Solirubrobacterales bacterium]|nr:CBS domain-containing protein [Solirubrobacterales bacterium]